MTIAYMLAVLVISAPNAAMEFARMIREKTGAAVPGIVQNRRRFHARQMMSVERIGVGWMTTYVMKWYFSVMKTANAQL